MEAVLGQCWDAINAAQRALAVLRAQERLHGVAVDNVELVGRGERMLEGQAREVRVACHAGVLRPGSLLSVQPTIRMQFLCRCHRFCEPSMRGVRRWPVL